MISFTSLGSSVWLGSVYEIFSGHQNFNNGRFNGRKNNIIGRESLTSIYSL